MTKGHIYPYLGSHGRGIYVCVWIEIVSRNSIFKLEHCGGCTLFLNYCYLSTKLYFLRFKALKAVLLNVQDLCDAKLCA